MRSATCHYSNRHADLLFELINRRHEQTSTLITTVTAFNAVNTQIKNATAYNATTNTPSTLTGDSTTRTIQSQLRDMFNTPVSGAPGGSSTLDDFGISFQADGSLAVDSTKLSTALNDPNKDVSKLFASSGSVTGYASQTNTLVTSMLGTGGLLGGRTAGINSSMQDITKQETALNLRLATIQKNYTAEFNNLDSMLSDMSSTSSYLTQQFASLASMTKSA